MKKFMYLFIALTLLVSVGVVSCDKVKDALEITLKDVKFDVDINVAELTTKDGGVTFGGSGTIDPASIPELADYLALIRGVNVTEIKVTVISVTPATGLSLNSASFSITDMVNNANFTYQITSPVPITVGTEFVINSSTPNFNVVSEIISSLHEANVVAGGNVSQAGFVLGFNYSITADVTVGVP